MSSLAHQFILLYPAMQNCGEHGGNAINITRETLQIMKQLSSFVWIGYLHSSRREIK